MTAHRQGVQKFGLVIRASLSWQAAGEQTAAVLTEIYSTPDTQDALCVLIGGPWAERCRSGPEVSVSACQDLRHACSTISSELLTLYLPDAHIRFLTKGTDTGYQWIVFQDDADFSGPVLWPAGHDPLGLSLRSAPG